MAVDPCIWSVALKLEGSPLSKKKCDAGHQYVFVGDRAKTCLRQLWTTRLSTSPRVHYIESLALVVFIAASLAQARRKNRALGILIEGVNELFDREYIDGPAILFTRRTGDCDMEIERYT